jgi:hypothetical protein
MEKYNILETAFTKLLPDQLQFFGKIRMASGTIQEASGIYPLVRGFIHRSEEYI